jgi:hypothetical protein
MPSDPARYRTGRHNRPFVYLQEGPEPADSDPLVCAVFEPYTAERVLALLNERQPIADALAEAERWKAALAECRRIIAAREKQYNALATKYGERTIQ